MRTEEVLQGPRSIKKTVEIEGVMQHENGDAWRHSFRMVRAPPKWEGDLKPDNYVNEASCTWIVCKEKIVVILLFKEGRLYDIFI